MQSIDHVQVEIEDGLGAYITDQGTAHGTFVDTVRMRHHHPFPLRHGSQVRGQEVLSQTLRKVFEALFQQATTRSYDGRRPLLFLRPGEIRSIVANVCLPGPVHRDSRNLAFARGTEFSFIPSR